MFRKKSPRGAVVLPRPYPHPRSDGIRSREIQAPNKGSTFDGVARIYFSATRVIGTALTRYIRAVVIYLFNQNGPYILSQSGIPAAIRFRYGIPVSCTGLCAAIN